MSPVSDLKLHHVSIVVKDVERSAAFYRDLFGFEPLERPPFKSVGVWLAAGLLQVHLIQHRLGTFRQAERIDADDAHFALNTRDFEGFIRHAVSRGFVEDGAEDDPKRMLVRRQGLAGFPQVYLLDPDYNIVEVNGAA